MGENLHIISSLHVKNITPEYILHLAPEKFYILYLYHIKTLHKKSYIFIFVTHQKSHTGKILHLISTSKILHLLFPSEKLTSYILHEKYYIIQLISHMNRIGKGIVNYQEIIYKNLFQ